MQHLGFSGSGVYALATRAQPDEVLGSRGRGFGLKLKKQAGECNRHGHFRDSNGSARCVGGQLLSTELRTLVNTCALSSESEDTKPTPRSMLVKEGRYNIRAEDERPGSSHSHCGNVAVVVVIVAVVLSVLVVVGALGLQSKSRSQW